MPALAKATAAAAATAGAATAVLARAAGVSRIGIYPPFVSTDLVFHVTFLFASSHVAHVIG